MQTRQTVGTGGGGPCPAAAGGSCTARTPTSWSRRRGCATTPTRRCATASPLRYPGGNELRQTGDVAEQQRDLVAAFDRLADKHRSAACRADEEEQIMLRKNFAATGSFLAESRPQALDLLGFSSQLVFNTFLTAGCTTGSTRVIASSPKGTAWARNRGMVEFCSVDDRLLPTCYVPLADIEARRGLATEAIELGAAALLVASSCPPGHSPSHIGLDQVMGAGEEADIPIVFHVGSTGDLVDPGCASSTASPVPPDFHGGEENFRCVDYMGIRVRRRRPWPRFDLRRRARPRFRRCGSASSSRAPSGCRAGPARWSRRSRPSPGTRSGSAPVAAPHREMRRAPGARHPVPDRGRGLDRGQSGPDDVAVQLPTTPTSRAGGGARAVRDVLGDADKTVRRKFYCDNFVDLMGRAGLGLAS
ncbi:MAG: hypothetical protein R2699_06075 [Acidimicrobiales bacterium]